MGFGEIRLDEAAPGEPAWIGGVRSGAGAPAGDEGLRGALRRAPDPGRAARLAGQLLDAIAGEELASLAERSARDLVRVVAAVCGVAPFLAPHLRRHPDWLGRLLESDLSSPRDPATLRESVAQSLRQAGLAPPAAEAALRHLKYFELARLSVRDACPEWVPLERSETTLRELSQLADALLEGVLQVAAGRLTERCGPPVWIGPDGREVALGFCILGLGKLGSEELNYSSDVDLVYIHQAPPEGLRGGPAGLAPADYFTRLARAIAPLAADTTVDGFLYRIDLELRPEGSRGPIVLSDESLARYYETSADTWEKAAFMKARPVAGDLELGWRAIRSVSPMIYRSAMDFEAVSGIRRLKEKVEEAHGRSESGFNVKIDSGGIRDLEFIAQAMQLLHGGRIPQIRGRSTLTALTALGEVDLLQPAVVAELQAAYRFLRRAENRIQMEEERQRHVVPRDPAARVRLARAMGYGGDGALEVFDTALAGHRERVLRHFASFGAEGDAERIAEIFARNAPQLVGFPTTRTMMEQLAGSFAREIERSPDREMALNNLDRFIHGLGGRSFYYELLMDRPELVPRLTALFGASRFLSDILARHPRLIEPLFENPERLLLSPDELRADLASLILSLSPADATGAPDPETELAALRLFHYRQIANVGLLDIAGAIDRDAVGRALSEVAQVCVEHALVFARQQLARRAAELPEPARRARFLVVGMGKLGSREMGYGSDLDLIFLYDARDVDQSVLAAAQDHFVRLAQRLISALHTPTAEGSCYEIDARMRPSGNQGSLVTSLEAFRRYHDREAATWERQALLRARAIAGDAELARDFADVRLEILTRPLPDSARDDIDHVRRRMEIELAREGGGRHDFKIGRGGVLDVENVVQYLRLQHGARHHELLEPLTTAESLAELCRLGVLDEATGRTLQEGWRFLERLSAGLRVVENRSISDLDEERGDLDGLARRLGYRSERRRSEARRALLRDYRRHTDSIRAVYERVFRGGSPSGSAPAS